MRQHYSAGHIIGRGLDYEWPRVRVVMGGWGLGGSNGELIETQFNCCRYKKRTKRVMRKHMKGMATYYR